MAWPWNVQRADHARSVPPVAFSTAATILPAVASISSSVSVFSVGCSTTSMASDLRSGAEGRALEEIEDRDAGDQLAVGALRRAHHRRRLDRAVEDEGEVAADRLEIGQATSGGLRPGRPRLRHGDRLEDDLEAGERPGDVELLQHLRMEFAERRR